MASYRKVVLVILDGLRPEAISPAVMPGLTALAAEHWRAAHAVTVSPSVTVAALTSLATGVSPARHGLVQPGLRTLGMFAASPSSPPTFANTTARPPSSPPTFPSPR